MTQPIVGVCRVVREDLTRVSRPVVYPGLVHA
jgi:hypothetical protein